MRLFTDLLFAQGHFATPTALRDAGLLEIGDDKPIETQPEQDARAAQNQLARRPNVALSHGWS